MWWAVMAQGRRWSLPILWSRSDDCVYMLRIERLGLVVTHMDLAVASQAIIAQALAKLAALYERGQGPDCDGFDFPIDVGDEQ